jgi:DNA-nicking Smr family endonuclease
VKKPGNKSGRHPPDDDEELWRHTARSVEPLKRGKPRVYAAVEQSASTDQPPRPKTASRGSGASAPKAVPALPAAPKPAKPPPISEFDRKTARKIRRGAAAIEARIDLHGMRQDEAHAALRRFIQRAAADGKKWVLVITGKGKLVRDDDDELSAFGPRERGVLRRNVPRWLEEPDLRHLVVSYATAAIQHGGDGALYLHLRTRQQ